MGGGEVTIGKHKKRERLKKPHSFVCVWGISRKTRWNRTMAVCAAVNVLVRLSACVRDQSVQKEIKGKRERRRERRTTWGKGKK